jgi:K+-transporting ATPase ATPase C chain
MLEVMKQLKTGVILLFLLSLLTGIVYPAMVTGVAQVLFPWHANGSLIWKNDKVIGSELIGQSFSAPSYFWGRPSATVPYPYNAVASSGSNAGPLNPDYLTAVKNRMDQSHQSNPNAGMEVPIDMVTTSASGLDPEISPLAAMYQVNRVALARKIPKEQVKHLVEANIQHRLWGIIGEPRINIMQLNLALDAADRGANQ